MVIFDSRLFDPAERNFAITSNPIFVFTKFHLKVSSQISNFISEYPKLNLKADLFSDGMKTILRNFRNNFRWLPYYFSQFT